MPDQDVSVNLNAHLTQSGMVSDQWASVHADMMGVGKLGGVPYPINAGNLGGFYGGLPLEGFASQNIAAIPTPPNIASYNDLYGGADPHAAIAAEMSGRGMLGGVPYPVNAGNLSGIYGSHSTADFGQQLAGMAPYSPPPPQAVSFAAPTPDIYAGSRYEGPQGIPYSAPDASSGMNGEEWSAVATGGGKRAAPVAVASPYGDDGPFKYKSNLRADKIRDLENQFAEMPGGFAKIRNSQEWATAEQDALEPLGLAAPMEEETHRSFGSKYMHAFRSTGGEISVGMAAIQAGERLSQNAARNDSGAYVTPEQRAASDMTATAGGVGSIIGLGLGALTGTPGGAMLGSMAGGAAGNVMGADFAAGQERHQAGRETAEMLATQLGAASDKVKEFAETLASAGAPIKELQTAIATLTGLSPGANATTTVSGAAGLSNALGERFNPALAGSAHFLGSDANLMGMAPEFAAKGGNLGASELGNLSVNAAFSGNWQASNDLATLQEGAIKNPNYSRDKSFIDREAPDSDKDYFTNPGRYDAAEEAKDRLKGESEYLPGHSPADVKKTADERAAAFGVHVASARAQVGASTAFSLAGNALSLLGATGANDAALDAAASGVYSAADTAASAFDSASASIGDYVSKHKDMSDSDRLSYEQQQAQLQIQSGTARQTAAQVRRERFMGRMDTDAANFGLGMTQDQTSGMSAADMASDISKRQDYLSGVISDPQSPPKPSEKAAMEAQRLQLGFQSTQAINSQAEAGIGIGAAQVNVGLATAQTTGGAGDVYQARGGQISSEVEMVRQLRQELDGVNLSYDQRQEKQTRVLQLTADITQAESSRRNEYFAAQGDLLATNHAADTAGNDRNILRGGNSAFDANVLGDTDAQIGLAQRKLSAAVSVQEKADARRDIQVLGNQKDAELDQANTFHPSAEQNQYEINTRGEFQRSLLNPWMDGPDSNPFTRGAAVLALDRGKLQALDANKQRIISSGGRWEGEDQTRYTEARNGLLNDQAQMEHAERFAMFNAVPEALLGSPGGGVGSAVMPLSALSAMFSASPIAGSFGRSTPTASAHMEREGGAAGAFSAAAGGKSEMLQMVDLLRELVRNTRGGPGSPPPNMAPVAQWMQNQTITR
jgi:hypothetical protein